MKSAGMYFVGFVVLLGGILAALRRSGLLASIGMAWTPFGIATALGIAIRLAVSNRGAKENIEIYWKAPSCCRRRLCTLDDCAACEH